MSIMKRVVAWLLLFSLVASPLCQSSMIVFAETEHNQDTDIEIHKNEKNQAYVVLPQINSDKEVHLTTITPMDLQALEEEQSIQIIHSNEEHKQLSFIFKETDTPFHLYFDANQVIDQPLTIEQDGQITTSQLRLDKSFTDTSVSEVMETTESNQLIQEETSSSEAVGVEPETNQGIETATSSETETSTSTESSAPTKAPQTKEAKSSDLTQEVVKDRDAGWKLQANKQITLSIPTNSGSQVSYGFATEEDLFLTNIFLMNQQGQRIDYRNQANSSKERGIRFYSFEKVGDYTAVEHVALNNVAISGDKIRGYGEFTINHNLVYSYKVIVRLTLSPNPETGDIQKQIELKRVDKPLLGDPQPMNVGFTEIVDTELNNHDNVDVAYIGNNRGLFIENTPYKAAFKVANGQTAAENPNKWGSAKGMYLDLSIGIHWLYRYAEPSDFFKGHSIIDSDVHGLEEKNGQPGEIAAHYSDSAIAMMWNKQKVKPQETRTISYTISLSDTTKPELALQSDIPTSLLEGKQLETITGTIKATHSQKVNVLYAIDNNDYQTAAEVATEQAGDKYNWQINTIDLSAYKAGRHTITFVAQDNEGNLSEKVTRTFRIVAKDTKYVLDSMVTNTNGLLTNVHPGDRLHYEIYLENKGKNIYFHWENEFSNYLALDKQSIKVENRRDPNPDIKINGQTMVYDATMALNEHILFSFDALVKDESLGISLSKIVNKSNFYEKGSTQTPLVKSEISLANEGKVTNFPKPTLETQLPNKTIKEGDELVFESQLGNDAINKEIAAGAWKHVQYAFPEQEGLELKEIHVLDKNGKPLPSDQVECSVISNVDQQSIEKSYTRMAIAQFKKEILPKEGYTIQVVAKAAEGASKLSKPITIETSAFGSAQTEEEVEITKNVTLPKIKPKELLAITDVTGDLNFGQQTIKKETQKNYAKDLKIKVQDTRTAANGWTLQVKSQIENESGDQLPLFFEEQKQQPSPLAEGVTIHEKGEKDLSFGETNEYKIYTEISAAMKKGNYQGSISWNLMDVP